MFYVVHQGYPWKNNLRDSYLYALFHVLILSFKGMKNTEEFHNFKWNITGESTISLSRRRALKKGESMDYLNYINQLQCVELV